MEHNDRKLVTDILSGLEHNREYTVLLLYGISYALELNRLEGNKLVGGWCPICLEPHGLSWSINKSEISCFNCNQAWTFNEFFSQWIIKYIIKHIFSEGEAEEKEKNKRLTSDLTARLNRIVELQNLLAHKK